MGKIEEKYARIDPHPTNGEPMKEILGINILIKDAVFYMICGAYAGFFYGYALATFL